MPTKRLAIGVFALLLAGCGFQLRGTIDLPPDWQNLHLDSVSPNSELTNELRNRGSQAGINWQDRGDATYSVQLGNERFQNRNLTIGTNARAAEFELEMSTQIRVVDNQGNEILPSTEVTSVQVITNDPENIAGKAEEARLLRNEMRTALVSQILRKLRFLAENAPPT